MSTSPYLIINSNSIENLANIASSIMQDNPLSDPFEQESILVMSLGMRTYLSQHFAKLNKIEACSSYIQTWELIWSIYKKIFANVPALNFFDRSHLIFNIIALKDQWNRAEDVDFAHLQNYISNDKDGSKLFYLASKLGDIFDQYQLYRQDYCLLASSLDESAFAQLRQSDSGVLADFFRAESKGNSHIYNSLKNNAWQFKLYNLLHTNIDIDADLAKLEGKDREHLRNDRAMVLKNLISTLEQSSDLSHCGLPERIFIFGVSTLPPLVLSFLQALSAHVQIYFMLLNPCMDYWGDLRSNYKDYVKDYSLKLKRGQLKADQDCKLEAIEENLSLSEHKLNLDHYDQDGVLVEGHPLLLNLGLAGRDNLSLLLQDNDGPVFIDSFIEQDNDSLLRQVQNSLLHLHLPAQKTTIATSDRSLQIHSCHSIKRELEVLKDELLHLFKQAALEGQSLRPRDIVVMVPTINSYAPYINAVFANNIGDANTYIPYAISDRTMCEQSAVVESVLALLSIYKRKTSAVLILELLEIEAIAKRFGIEHDDLGLLEKWLKESHIHWGLNSHDIHEISAIDLNCSFEHGLNRMLYGLMSGRDQEGASYNDIEGSDAILLGRLCKFIAELAHLRTIFDPYLVKSPLEWGALLSEHILGSFYDEDDHSYSDLMAIEREIKAMQETCLSFKEQPSISLAVFHAMLENKLAASRDYTPFLKDKVNFCSLMPMRAVPFKHVFILGLNDMDYPRADRAASFNLMSLAAIYRKGDRKNSYEDRYLFLEYLMTAQQSLYLSYIGHSMIDSQEQNPSVVIKELIDFIQDHFVSADDSSIEQRLITHERMCAYDKDNYCLDNALHKYKDSLSFDSLNLLNLSHKQKLGTKLITTSDQALSDSDLDISLDEVLKFYKSPCAFFLKRNFHIDTKIYDQKRLSTVEPFVLDNLQRGDILERLIASYYYAGDLDLSKALDLLEQSGSMPYGSFRLKQNSELKTCYLNLISAHQQHPLSNRHSVVISHQRYDLAIEQEDGSHTYSLKLNASIDLPLSYSNYYSYKISNEIKNHTLFELAIKAAFASLKEPQDSVQLYTLDGSYIQKPLFNDTFAASDFLRKILSLYLRGHQQALPLCRGFIDTKEVEKYDFAHDEAISFVYKNMDNVLATADLFEEIKALIEDFRAVVGGK